jgi:hypothetical protein
VSNAFDDLPPTSPELQAMQAAPHMGNAFDDLTPPVKPVIIPSEQSGWDEFGQGIKRGAGLTARALIEGATALPMMIPNALQGMSDLIHDPHPPKWSDLDPRTWVASDAPSERFNRGLDPVLPTPQSKSERVASMLLGMEGGALIPAIPTPGAAAPAGFQNAAQMDAQRLSSSLKQVQQKGFVVPPSTTNPTTMNTTLESLAGKELTQNSARAINQQARNAAAATDIGLKPGVFTPSAVAAVKKEAGLQFENARAIPTVNTDAQYSADLDKVLQNSQGANASFPGASNPDIEKMVGIYRQPSFTGDAAVSAVKMLRGKASDAYSQGNSETGMAYKGLSAAIENQLERGAQGGPYADLVSSLRAARKTYARASTIEDAMDPNGNVSGTKLAAAWNRGEPLDGGLLQAAEHAANYPKANSPANSSNVSHLNAVGSLFAAKEGYDIAGWKGAAAGLALPYSRQGARAALLSPMGQAMARPGGESYTARLARMLADPRLLAGGAANAQ